MTQTHAHGSCASSERGPAWRANLLPAAQLEGQVGEGVEEQHEIPLFPGESCP